MWNLRHVFVSTHTDTGVNAAYQSPVAGASRVAHTRRPRALPRAAILLIALLTVLPIACSLYTLTAPSVSLLRQGSAMGGQQCPQETSGCDNDGGAPIGPSHGVGVDTGLPAPAALPCEELCARIRATYPDARTQALLLPLAQTPTGHGALTYLLTLGDRLGPDFISWQDLGAEGSAGLNTAGGYIQLNTAMLRRRDLGPYFLSGTLLHEAIESYFDIAEGIRDMGTRHADYVAQWFNGKFERELHALPYYDAQDPFYLPDEYSAYGLSYAAWLGTEDGQLYLGNPEEPDLRRVDRKGHAWAPSDWLAEQGGFWAWGQGTDVTPVPNPLGLTPAMLLASDLSVFAL
jgi:hypothetical protein